MRLDVGCGFNKHSDSIGIDLRRTYRFHDGVVRKSEADIIADAVYLPIKTGCIKTVYSCRCIQHVKRDIQALAEIKRVKQPYGEATVILASWRGWLYYQIKYFHRKKPYPLFHRYTMGKLQLYVPKAKISVVGKGLHKDLKVEF
jgi:ubiquinone/menaquinone biosynthesis C-methylase UbiE